MAWPFHVRESDALQLVICLGSDSVCMAGSAMAGQVQLRMGSEDILRVEHMAL